MHYGLFELNPAAEGLRFPTQAQIEKIMEDTDTERSGTTDVDNYTLAKKYFPENAIKSTELEMYAVKNPYDYA